jgi:hypothetical protein
MVVLPRCDGKPVLLVNRTLYFANAPDGSRDSSPCSFVWLKLRTRLLLQVAPTSSHAAGSSSQPGVDEFEQV